MKVLTINFLTCAIKACKSSSASFPLHPKEAELVQDDIELNPQFLINVLPRIDWKALRTTSTEVGKYGHRVLENILASSPALWVTGTDDLVVAWISGSP